MARPETVIDVYTYSVSDDTLIFKSQCVWLNKEGSTKKKGKKINYFNGRKVFFFLFYLMTSIVCGPIMYTTMIGISNSIFQVTFLSTRMAWNGVCVCVRVYSMGPERLYTIYHWLVL